MPKFISVQLFINGLFFFFSATHDRVRLLNGVMRVAANGRNI